MDDKKDSKIPLEALFTYEGSIRTLINAIKINRCIVSLAELSDLVLDHNKLARYLDGIETITPVGSSLFSKIHGKFDISYFIAHRISQEFCIPLVSAKNPNKWRYKKRSMTEQKNNSATSSKYFQDSNRYSQTTLRGAKPNLVIDDVITTGFTLYQQVLSTGFPQSQLKCLALCDARSKKICRNFGSLNSPMAQPTI